MRTTFTFRQFDASDNLKDMIQQRIDKRITKLADTEDAECRVTLSMEKAWITVEISVSAYGEIYKSSEKTVDDLNPVVDLVLDKLERQLLRRKEMVQDRRTRRS